MKELSRVVWAGFVAIMVGALLGTEAVKRRSESVSGGGRGATAAEIR